MPWNPDLYRKFQAERSAPFYDLLALVDVRANLKVIDLGCGSGELTRQLADRLPNSLVTGLTHLLKCWTLREPPLSRARAWSSNEETNPR